MVSYFAVPKLIGFVPVSETYSVHTATRERAAPVRTGCGTRGSGHVWSTQMELTGGAGAEN